MELSERIRQLVILYKGKCWETVPLKYRNTREMWSNQKYMALKHLLSFCKIKDKERHRLIDMINSSDTENYTVAEQIILNKLNYAETPNLPS